MLSNFFHEIVKPGKFPIKNCTCGPLKLPGITEDRPDPTRKNQDRPEASGRVTAHP